MSIKNLLGSPTPAAKRSPPKRRSLRRLGVRLEPLEDRRMLSFSTAVDYTVGSHPADVVAADFNADGRLDLATVNSASNDVSVVLGNADGTFQAALVSANVNNPLSLAAGDFNADGKLDLATANVGNVSVLAGNGDGTFQAPANIDIGSSPSSVAVGDFNSDGKLDLGVTSNIYYPGSWGYYGWYPGYNAGRANVLLGTGGGTFGAPTSAPTYYGYHNSTALADFNGDGKLDFATASYESGFVVMLPGTGTGTLGAASFLSTGYASWSLAAGDVNGDGKPDLVSANQYGDSVAVLLATGAGGFANAQSFSAGSYPAAVALGDVNGDGDADIISANSGDGTVSVLLGTGVGTFKSPVNAAAGTGAAGLAVGQFNGDGRLDVASANSSSSNVSVLLGDGIWTALDAPSIAIGDAAQVSEGNIGTVSAIFTVSLSSAYGQTVSVQYATNDGVATLAGGDYQSTSGTLTFAPGETSKTVTVLVNGDRIAEYGESFSVHLTSPVNAFVTDATGAGYILDDEPVVSIIDYVVGAEGNTGTTTFAFSVTLSAAYDAPVTVEYSTSDLTEEWLWYYGYNSATADVDYVATSTTLTFAPGETSTSIMVSIIGDRLGEWDEQFLVNLTNPTSAMLGGSFALTHIMDDEPYLSIVPSASIAEGNTGTTALALDVTLTAAYDVPVTVNYSLLDGTALAGSDYLAQSGTLTFAPGVTSVPLSVLVKGDITAEPEEYFLVALSEATNANIGNYNLVYATILDDDTPPQISISDASVVEGNSGTTLVFFTVSLLTPSGSDVWVNYKTANGTAKTSDNDYVAQSGTVHFAPGETTKTIEIVVKGDKRKEKQESFRVNLSGAVHATIVDSQGTGTIINDDGGGKWRNQLAFAAAVDAAIENWMPFGRKKRGW